MTKRYFEFNDGKSSKFWEVWSEGNEVNTRYGKIGTTGQTTVKAEADDEAATARCEQLVREKTKKGYQEHAASRATTPPTPASTTSVSAVGTLNGKLVVVTGSFAEPRATIEKRLVDAGATIGSGVSAKTQLLVVGADAGSKLANAKKLGVPMITEAELGKLLERSAPSASTPPAGAKPADWMTFAKALEANGDPRGKVLTAQLALAKNPKDAALRAAEKAARASLLTGPLVDVVARFEALVDALRADPKVIVHEYATREPATEQELFEVERAIGAPLHPSIATFFRQTNGLVLYADRRDRDGFETMLPAVGNSKQLVLRSNDISYGLDIPALKTIFLDDEAFTRLGFDEDLSADELIEFGKKKVPGLAFAKSLRSFDLHNDSNPVCFILHERPGNPRVGMAEDSGENWSRSKATDFETFLTTFLDVGGRQDKMNRLLRS